MQFAITFSEDSEADAVLTVLNAIAPVDVTLDFVLSGRSSDVFRVLGTNHQEQTIMVAQVADGDPGIPVHVPVEALNGVEYV